MMPFTATLLIIAVHWIADFLLQNKWMAENKSSSWEALLTHTGVYTLVITALWLLLGLILPTGHVIILLAITFIVHTAIDFVTSRAGLRVWNSGKTRTFFNIIGFDQLLHYFQLYTTYYLCWHDVSLF